MANEFGPALTTVARGYATDQTREYVQSLLPSLINLGYSEGMSGRGMLAAFREAGIPIANNAYWQMASDVRLGLANVEQVAGLDLATTPDLSAFAPWITNRVKGFMYRVNAVFSRPRAGQTEPDVVTKKWSLRSNVRLALGDVFSDLYDQMTSDEVLGSFPNETLVGMTIDNMFQFVS